MKTLFVCLPAVLLLAYSCSKETPVPTQQPTPELKDDFVNPYNFVGEIHNIALEEAINDPGFSEESDFDRLRMIDEIRIDEYDKREIDPIDCYYTSCDMSIYTIKTGEQLYQLELANMTFDQKTYMNAVKALLDNFDNSTFDDVNEIEDDISKDNSLSSLEQDELLAGIALAKYSAYFWEEHPEYLGFNGVWKADWHGFWAGYHSGAPGYTWFEQIGNGIDMAGTASEIQRQDRN